jgi:YegS/Rv2252/BmrU family lipid kinase
MNNQRKKKPALIIVNPYSGNRRGKQVANLIAKKLSSHYDIEFYYTEGAESATREVKKRLSEIEAVFVVGGDGTINDVLQGIVGSQIPMGVFPFGSGNATALEMGIRSMSGGIKKILGGRIRTIDCAQLNGRYFVNLAGIGFDSVVAHEFQTRKHRGLVGYILVSGKNFLNYRPLNLTINSDNKRWDEKVFMVTIANMRQMGNNALIAPMAKPDDGILDLCIIRPFPRLQLPDMGFKLFSGKLNESQYYHHKHVTQLRIEGDFEYVHIDGEPIRVDGIIEVSIVPNSVRIFA